MEELPDKNVFMMCPSLNRFALTELPKGYHIRTCRRDELDLWKAMPFDDAETAEEYHAYMTEFFETTYGGQEDLFFEKTLFVCDEKDKPVATCFLWKAYQLFNTVHWLKVVKGQEGRGLGRALLSILMKNLEPEEYPIYLHTQPESYRAIKLYSDFGFYLLSDKMIGSRPNDLEECLPILEKYMPKKDFQNLKIRKAPKVFLEGLKKFDTIEF